MKLAPKDDYFNQGFLGGKTKGGKGMDKVYTRAAQPQKHYSTQECTIRTHYEVLIPCISDPSYYF